MGDRCGAKLSWTEPCELPSGHRGQHEAGFMEERSHWDEEDAEDDREQQSRDVAQLLASARPPRP